MGTSFQSVLILLGAWALASSAIQPESGRCPNPFKAAPDGFKPELLGTLTGGGPSETVQRTIRRWPYQRGTIARILKRNALPIESLESGMDQDDNEEHEEKRSGGLFLRTSKSLVEPWKYFNRYGRAAGMFLRSSKSSQAPRMQRSRGLFLRTSRGSSNRNGFFLRTAKDLEADDIPDDEDWENRSTRSSNTGMFLRNF